MTAVLSSFNLDFVNVNNSKFRKFQFPKCRTLFLNCISPWFGQYISHLVLESLVTLARYENWFWNLPILMESILVINHAQLLWVKWWYKFLLKKTNRALLTLETNDVIFVYFSINVYLFNTGTYFRFKWCLLFWWYTKKAPGTLSSTEQVTS